MNGFETILPFLKPIEHLILDDSISEVMVNGPDRIFIEKAGFVEPVQWRKSRREILDGRGEEYCPATGRRHLGIETHPRFTAARMAAASPPSFRLAA